MEHPYLVSFDTDRIKDYVFATDKLREIRGASALLNRLNDPAYMKGVIQSVYPGYDDKRDRVFFAGGSGAILVPNEEKAQEVIQAVEKAYRQETSTASITGVYLPLAPASETKDFGKRMEVAGLRLREEKDRKARRTTAMIEPYTQPCAACERYPATRVSPVDQLPVCDSCQAKREAARGKADKAPEDLTQLGQLSHPPDYIGFVYADGNQMGELLSQMEALSDYHELATGLDKLIRDSVDESLKQHPLHGGATQPYDQLLVGGDDLMLVTTGDFALDAALDIARRFENDSPAVAGRLLTLGIGVVLAHASFPIAAFHRLASQLLKSAKRRCAELNYATSAIDFMVVTAAGSSDVGTFREEALAEKAFVFPHGDRKVRLTQRPYKLDDAQKLIGHVRAFKQARFPRSQLQFLYEGLFHSQVEAVYRWGKVAGRVKKEHRELMEKFYAEFGDAALGLPPWRRDIDMITNTDVFTSALGDLVEIYPFVPE